MGEIVLVGLGLNDEMGISLRGLEEVRKAEEVFIELYTNLMPDFSAKRFEEISGKEPHPVSRMDLEEKNGKVILEAAERGKAVFLVPGDPLIATTHVALRIQAQKLGIKTRIVHGTSILSAAIGISGLHNYKFGKNVTIPLHGTSETPYEVITQNKGFGLHTLCLLDVKVEENRYMSIHEGLKSLLKIEHERKEKMVTMETLVVGVARVGSNKPTVKAGLLEDLLCYDFGGPPQSIVFPGKLHFMEVEALIVLADAPEKLRRALEVGRMSTWKLVAKYIDSAECVLKELEATENSMNLDEKRVEEVVEHAKAYLDDAKYYRDNQKLEVSLVSVAYCEGLLDALKLLGAVKFEWPAERKTIRER